MIAVLFEAQAVAAQQSRYLALAAELRSELESTPGFIAIERFQSLSTEGILVRFAGVLTIPGMS